MQSVVVQESIKADLAQEILLRVQALRVGDPMDEMTDMGTLISREACDRVENDVHEAQQAGATTLTGGRRLGETLYAPTVLDKVPRTSRIATEEAFAPLILLMDYATLEEAIAIANATPYGLNAGIFTNDLREAFAAAREIVAGTVCINDVPTFRSDLMPYGGRKQSGLGREGVRFAMEEMTELKVISVRS